VIVCVVGRIGKLCKSCLVVFGSDGSQAERVPNGDPAPCQNELRNRTISRFGSFNHVSASADVFMGSGCHNANPTATNSSRMRSVSEPTRFNRIVSSLWYTVKYEYIRSHNCAIVGGSAELHSNVADGLRLVLAHCVLSDSVNECPCVRIEKDSSELCSGNGGSRCDFFAVDAGAGVIRYVVLVPALCTGSALYRAR
jgi:hypothetical protein